MPGSTVPWRQADGVFALEFVLVMITALALFLPVAEIYRLSLFDQALARATHEGARAAAANPSNCAPAVIDAFNENAFAVWLLDLNDDSRIGVQTRPASSLGWPMGSPADEAYVSIVADENLFDGVDWEAAGCGAPDTDSWILVRSRIVVNPLFGPLRLIWPDGFRRQQQSWARNQT